VKQELHRIKTGRLPNIETKDPVKGVAIAVANTFKVITHDICSWVAERAPWSWGNIIFTNVMDSAYNIVVPAITINKSNL
tara:strand:+ start:266 stop:505 length:240 start_codon:yes stop_codon:yes gene_type:complete